MIIIFTYPYRYYYVVYDTAVDPQQSCDPRDPIGMAYDPRDRYLPGTL